MTTISHPAHDLLARAHSPDTSAEIYKTQVKHRPLLLKAIKRDPDARQTRRSARSKADLAARRAAKRASKAGRNSLTTAPKPLSAKAKRTLGIYDIPKEQRRWELYIGLHQLWCDYIRDVLGVQESMRKLTPDGAGPLLGSADYHGAVMTVVRSGCVSRVGLEGIVVKDTRFTFEMVTRRNKLVIVPKEGTVFRIQVPKTGTSLDEGAEKLVFEIYGDNLQTSAPDRANKKFKLHIDPGV